MKNGIFANANLAAASMKKKFDIPESDSKRAVKNI